MYPTKEQLNSKWWHRLSKVLRWVLTIGVLVFFTGLSFDEACGRGNCDGGDLFIGLLYTVGLTLITYFGLWLIYKKIILYIAFGKK